MWWESCIVISRYGVLSFFYNMGITLVCDTIQKAAGSVCSVNTVNTVYSVVHDPKCWDKTHLCSSCAFCLSPLLLIATQVVTTAATATVCIFYLIRHICLLCRHEASSQCQNRSFWKQSFKTWVLPFLPLLGKMYGQHKGCLHFFFFYIAPDTAHLSAMQVLNSFSSLVCMMHHLLNFMIFVFQLKAIDLKLILFISFSM